MGRGGQTLGRGCHPNRTQAGYLGCAAPVLPGGVPDHRPRPNRPGRNGSPQLLRGKGPDRPLSVKPKPGIARRSSHSSAPSTARRVTPGLDSHNLTVPRRDQDRNTWDLVRGSATASPRWYSAKPSLRFIRLRDGIFSILRDAIEPVHDSAYIEWFQYMPESRPEEGEI